MITTLLILFFMIVVELLLISTLAVSFGLNPGFKVDSLRLEDNENFVGNEGVVIVKGLRVVVPQSISVISHFTSQLSITLTKRSPRLSTEQALNISLSVVNNSNRSQSYVFAEQVFSTPCVTGTSFQGSILITFYMPKVAFSRH